MHMHEGMYRALCASTHGICLAARAGIDFNTRSSPHAAAPPSPPISDMTTETIAGQLQWWSDSSSERWWVETYAGNYTLPRQPLVQSTDVGLIGMLPGQMLSIACTRPKTSRTCLSTGLATKENSWTEEK